MNLISRKGVLSFSSEIKIVVVSDLMPGPEIEYQRRVNRAVFDMVNGCQSFGVEIVRIIKPLHAVQWRRLKRTSMSVTSNEQGIEVVSQSVFNLPKLGFFPLPGELRKLTYLIKAADLLVSHMPNGGALASILSSKTGILSCIVFMERICWIFNF